MVVRKHAEAARRAHADAEKEIADGRHPLKIPQNAQLMLFFMYVREELCQAEGESRSEHMIMILQKGAVAVREAQCRIWNERLLRAQKGIGSTLASMVKASLWAQYPPAEPSEQDLQADEAVQRRAQDQDAARKEKDKRKRLQKKEEQAYQEGIRASQQCGGGGGDTAAAGTGIGRPARAGRSDPGSGGDGAHGSGPEAAGGRACSGTDEDRPETAPTRQGTRPGDNTAKEPKAPKPKPEYVPKVGTANYCLLITLYMVHKRGRAHIGKEELIDLGNASGLSNINLRGNVNKVHALPGDGSFQFSGWSSFTKLCNRDIPLVHKWSSPMKMKLTPQGFSLAARMYLDALARNKVAVPLPASVDVQADATLVGQGTLQGGATTVAGAAAARVGEAGGGGDADARRNGAGAARPRPQGRSEGDAAGSGSAAAARGSGAAAAAATGGVAAAQATPTGPPCGAGGQPSEVIEILDSEDEGSHKAHASGAGRTALQQECGRSFGSHNTADHQPAAKSQPFGEPDVPNLPHTSQAGAKRSAERAPGDSAGPSKRPAASHTDPAGGARADRRSGSACRAGTTGAAGSEARPAEGCRVARRGGCSGGLCRLPAEPAMLCPRGSCGGSPEGERYAGIGTGWAAWELAVLGSWPAEYQACPLRLPPLRPGSTFAQEYEVLLLLDGREQFKHRGSHASRPDLVYRHASHIRRPDVPVEVAHLPVGDAVWVARRREDHTKRFALDFIVERKGSKDLAASIQDGRYEHQKYWIQRCGLHRPIYLIEGDLHSMHIERDAKACKTAAAKTQIHGFTVLHTQSEDETKKLYQYLTVAISAAYAERQGPSAVAAAAAAATAAPPLESYEAWEARVKQMQRSRTVRDVWGCMLCAVPGVSCARGEAIVAHYPTPISLWRAYRATILQALECGADALAAARLLLANLRLACNSMRVGPAASRSVYDSLFATGWDVTAQH